MRTASCRCGQLSLVCAGEPVRISICHCLVCQRRTGSALSAQARWPDANVTIAGKWQEWQRTGDSGAQTVYRFCPVCGSTLSYAGETMPGLIAIPIGAFADPSFPPPHLSTYEERRHAWAAILGDDVGHVF